MKNVLTFLALSLTLSLTAQNYNFNFNTTGARVCLVEASVNLATPSVTIHLLDAASNTTQQTSIFRRPLYGTGDQWVSVASGLPAGTTQWIDVNVNAGEIWEYQVKRTGTWTYGGQSYDATGYTVGALLKDNSNYHGQLIFVVADNIYNGLTSKVKRLKKELTGDGWFVNELIVPHANGWDSGDTVVGIRNQIAAVYNNAPAGDKPKMVFILGHVPLPRSGSSTVTAPDGHDQNKGARGCDGYYADIDGVYTDANTFNPGGLATPLAVNLPGDYKWDQDFYPSELEMAFGRVDFADLIQPSQSELVLTEQYLDRLSNYKNVVSGWDMGDKSGFYVGYDNSVDGSYRTLPGISKSANVYQNTAGAPHPQWVQNNGPFKVYMQNQNFPELGEWETYGMNATVYSSDQSYWGFNDEPQSFYYGRIRGLLAENTKCLVTLWATTALNMFHQACSGEALGKAIKEVMNNNTVNNNIQKPQQNWDDTNWWGRTHFAYNGDPTIRLYQLQPASNLTIANVNNEAVLNWTASPDANVSGYHVYKSTAELGVYNRVTTNQLTTLTYTDNDYHYGDWYMVRAVETEESGCGQFVNPSLGIFVQGNLNLGLNENNLSHQLNVYPNPTNGEVIVKADFSMEMIRVLSADGRLITSLEKVNQHTLAMDLSGLNPGIYFIQTAKGKELITQKIIVE
ncbi:T9SS type A sorting domain-containing protein [Fluviicola sp.]|uniref:T9SS type A sorting domain-containing protein n=1 Tax=Fluviicola sp. TaxID=1917219 RepID=UPI0031E4437A